MDGANKRPFVWAVNCRLPSDENGEAPEAHDGGVDAALPEQEGNVAPETARLLYASQENPFKREQVAQDDGVKAVDALDQESAAQDVEGPISKAGASASDGGAAAAQTPRLPSAVAEQRGVLADKAGRAGGSDAAVMQPKALDAVAKSAPQRPTSATSSRPQVCLQQQHARCLPPCTLHSQQPFIPPSGHTPCRLP
jgi:hypothetical protein